MGKIIVNISIKDYYYNKLPLVITDNSLKKPLLGRNWLDIINPFWRSQIVSTKQVEVLVVNNNSVDKLKVKYP